LQGKLFMDKKLLFSVFLSLATVFAIRQFWGTSQEAQKGVVSVEHKVVAGQPVRVPTTEELYKPLQTDISFADEKISAREEKVVVKTDLVRAEFSNYGGVLKSLDFIKHTGKNNKPLRTVYDKGSFGEQTQKQGCFLVAIDEDSPYVYKLIDHKLDDDQHTITYQAQTADWVITKKYTLLQDSYAIKLTLGFEPKKEVVAPIAPRVFFVAPYLYELSEDVIKPFVLNESTSTVELKEIKDIHGLAWYWVDNKPIFGASNQYFAHALVNDYDKFVQRGYYKNFDNKSFFSILEGPEITQASSWDMQFYFGPKVYDQLQQVDERLGSILAFGWLTWFCKFIVRLLDFIYDYVGNYGIAIIVLSIVLRLPFVPLSIMSRRKMEGYQKHQPFLTHIRTKFKHDKRMQQQEIMRYHQDHNLSPATPMIGCLPILIQLPILFSLYRVLGSYLDLYQAPFFGWIHDLSAADPYYVLPVLMGVSMLVQQQLSPVGDDKQRVVMWFMAIFMTVVFAGFPAGLVLYWFMNNILTVSEDYLRKLVFK